MSDIKFGTDGWRGRIGDDYTFANVRRCAQGFANYLKANSKQGSVVVGHDRRFQAEHFAEPPQKCWQAMASMFS